jgi:hypothetical protein
VVNPEYLERHRPKANHAAKKRSRKSKPPQFSATLSEEIFMKAVSAFYEYVTAVIAHILLSQALNLTS